MNKDINNDLLELKIDSLKEQIEIRFDNIERWQDEQDRRLESLENTDKEMTKTYNDREATKNNTWFNLIMTFLFGLLSAIIMWLIQK